MMSKSALAPMAVSISISDSPDMAMLGLSNGHLRNAACEIATYLLADGVGLAYGGDLRPGGFTEMLFELLYRYRRRADTSAKTGIANYLAWPVHASMEADDLSEIMASLRGHARLVLIGQNGERMPANEYEKMQPHAPDKHEWSEGLTAMRKVMCEDTDARVVLGGAVENYKGRMPGIAEEVLLSLESGQPVFLIGGFGGCARDIAETLELVDTWAGSRPAWPGRRRFERYIADDLHNGLSHEENMALARAQYINQAVILVMRGIRRLRKKC